MDVNNILIAVLIVAGIAALIALVLLFLELTKTIKSARKMVDDLGPTLKNVETMTTNLQAPVAKVDPIVDRVTLTLDSVNLEMMRVDQLLEDLTQITGTASSATTAVDNIASAPVKAVSNVATRVKTAFGGRSASEESAQLAEQRVAVARALEDYKAAEAAEAKKAAKEASQDPEVEQDDDLKDPTEPIEYIEIKEEATEAAEAAEATEE